jgi:hypothetical protein
VVAAGPAGASRAGPSTAQSSGRFYGMTALSATDAWAAGESHIYGHDQTYILHWNGTSWTQITSPQSPHTRPASDLGDVPLAGSLKP